MSSDKAPETDASSSLPDPGRYVVPWKPFSWVTVLISMLISGGNYGLAQSDNPYAVIASLMIGTLLGLSFTLAATAWGTVICLIENPVKGLAFMVFPPYMVYYAITRWRWMSQPSVLFVCGFGVMAVALFVGWLRLNELRAF